MAFDRPIEADRVDDLNLFSTFIRAPVIGTLMWILGGRQAQEEEDEQKEFQATLEVSTKTTSCQYSKTGNRKSALRKRSPCMVASDVSCESRVDDLMDCSDGSSDGFHDAPSSTLSRRKKELSWSDESGMRLCEIVNIPDDTVQCQAELKETAPFPRSVSVNHHMDEKRYLPRGLLERRQEGIMLPQHVPRPSDGESPLWGWYVRTTPPTPDVYPSKSVPKLHSGSNQIFEDLQNRNKAAPLAFPSMPL